MAKKAAVRVPKWMQSASAAELLAMARQRERGASRRYAWLARQAEDRVVRAKLRYLAAEEAEHERIIKGMAEGLPGPPKRSETPAGLSEVEQPLENETLESVLKLAIASERDSEKLYRATASLCSSAEVRRVFEGLADAEARHAVTLREELDLQRGAPAWRGLEGRIWAEEDFW